MRSKHAKKLNPQNNLSKHGIDIKSDDRLAFYIPHELIHAESTSILRTVKIHYGYLDSRGDAHYLAFVANMRREYFNWARARTQHAVL